MQVILPFAINECDGGPHEFYTEPTDGKGEVTVFLPSTMVLSTVTYGDATAVTIITDEPNMSAGFSASALSASSNPLPLSKTFGCCQTIRTSCNQPPSSTHDKCYHGGGDAIKLCEKLKDQIKPPCGSVLWTADGKCDKQTGLCGGVPTAITLASFDAKAGNNKVTLKWVTGDETDNLGFNVYRAEAKDGAYKKINQSLIASKVGSGLGTTYEFIDNNVKNLKTYFYKIEDVDVNGAVTQHGPIAATPRLIYGLFQ